MTATTNVPAWLNLDGLLTPETQRAILEAKVALKELLPTIDAVGERVWDAMEGWNKDTSGVGLDDLEVGPVGRAAGFEELYELTEFASYLLAGDRHERHGVQADAYEAKQRERFAKDLV